MVVVATDGSSLRNGQANSPSGWAYVFDKDRWKAGGLLRGTNQIVELLGVFMVLRDYPTLDLTIQTDSAYVIGCCTSWKKAWQKNGYKNSKGQEVSNKNTIIAIHHLLDFSRQKIEFAKVKAHDTQHRYPLNELADKYAKRAAVKAKNDGGEVLIGSHIAS